MATGMRHTPDRGVGGGRALLSTPPRAAVGALTVALAWGRAPGLLLRGARTRSDALPQLPSRSRARRPLSLHSVAVAHCGRYRLW